MMRSYASTWEIIAVMAIMFLCLWLFGDWGLPASYLLGGVAIAIREKVSSRG